MTTIEEQLVDIGLTPKEANIYAVLSQYSSAGANVLAKQTGTHRSVTYNILQQLAKKGLVTFVKKTGRREYSITSPAALEGLIREKQILAAMTAEQLRTVRKDLPRKQKVTVFEGRAGLRAVFEEIANVDAIRVMNATGMAFGHLKYIAKHLVENLEGKDVRIIAHESARKTELLDFEFQFRFLPKELEGSTTVFLFADVVIIQSLREKPYLVRIQNQDIARDYVQHFDYVWSTLEI